MQWRTGRSRVTLMLLLGLVAVGLLCGGAPGVLAQTDVTYLLTNPDFESGLTGWTVGSDGTALYYCESASGSAHSGSYKLRVGTSGSYGVPHSVGDASYVSQTVDLTGVDTLTFWYDRDADTRLAQRLYVSGDLLWQTTTEVSVWTYVELDVSSYSGDCTLKLGAWVVGTISTATYLPTYFDDIHLYSSTIVALDPPVMDAEPDYTQGTSNQVSWTDPNSPPATQYQARCSLDPLFHSGVVQTDWQSGISYTFNDLVSGGWYFYRARARAASSGAEADLFDEDFEDGNMDGWDAGSGTYTRQVTSATAAAGTTYSLTLTGGDETHQNGVSHDLDVLQPETVTFYVRSASTSASDAYFVLTTSLGNHQAVFFYMKSDGQMGIYDGTAFRSTAYSALTWYKIQIRFNWADKEVDLYVNDSLVHSDIPFRDSSVGALVKLWLYNWDSSQAWWDEIQFSRAEPGYVGSDWSSIVSSTQDAVAPSSQVDALAAQTKESSFSVSWTASDALSGVKHANLYYRHGGTGDYTQFGGDFTGTTTTFDCPQGDGQYELYTRATDNVDNQEDAPGAADTTTVVDSTPPETSAGPLDASYDVAVIDVPFTASDAGVGVDEVALWYRHQPFGGEWGAWTEYGSYESEASPVSFDTDTTGYGGYYEFYTIGTDYLGNEETAPVTADCATIVVTPTLDAPVMNAEPAYTPGDSNEVSWTDPNEPDAEQYQARCAEDESLSIIKEETGWQTEMSHTFEGLLPGETYWYQARARRVVAAGETSSWGQTDEADFSSDTHSFTTATIQPGDVVLVRGGGFSETDTVGDDWYDVSNFGKMRGNFYQCTSTHTLTKIQSYLSLADAQTLIFVVYEGTTKLGTYSKVHENTLTGCGPGKTWYSSGAIEVVLSSGKYYCIAVGFSGSATYYYDTEFFGVGGHPESVSFGQSVSGACADYPPPTTIDGQNDSAVFYQRLTAVAGTLVYVSPGSVVSTAITPSPLEEWETLTYDISTPASTNLEVDVLDASDDSVLVSDVASGTDLSDGGVAVSSIKLRARLSTSDGSVTPALHEWAVSWKQSPDIYEATDWSDAVQSTQDSGSAPNITGWAIAATHDGVGELICPVTEGHIDSRTCCIDCVVLSFTEALDPATVGASAIQIVGVTNGDVSWMVDSATLEGDGSTMRITTSAALPDPDWYTITVLGTVCDLAATPLAGDRDIKIGSLHGDANGNLTVDVGDLLAVRAKIGSAVDCSTARYDVNCNGTIDVGDMLAARAHVGNNLPPAP